jgi:hypothetical protein
LFFFRSFTIHLFNVWTVSKVPIHFYLALCMIGDHLFHAWLIFGSYLDRVLIYRRVKRVTLIKRKWYVRPGKKIRRCVLRRGIFSIRKRKGWSRIGRRRPKRRPKRVLRRRRRRAKRFRRKKISRRRRRRRRSRKRRRRNRRKRRRVRKRRTRRGLRRRAKRLRDRIRRLRLKRRSRVRRTRLRFIYGGRWRPIVRQGKRTFFKVGRRLKRIIFKRLKPYIRIKKRLTRRPIKYVG